MSINEVDIEKTASVNDLIEMWREGSMDHDEQADGDHMSMTAVDIDDEALARAREILGTTTKKDTINTALREVVRRQAVNDLFEMMDGDAFEYDDPEQLRRDAWGVPLDAEEAA
jgi:Arc/MetJ family transcription regulator